MDKDGRKYRLREVFYLLTGTYSRRYTKAFKDRLARLMGISSAKMARYIYAPLSSRSKVETVSVAHMRLIVEELNRVLPPEQQVRLEDMYHPDIAGEALDEYRTPFELF